jgi:hypothetical protein
MDNWPSTHHNKTCLSVPYNDTIFNLRNSYNDIFPKLISKNQNDWKDKSHDEGNCTDQMHKIKYSMNLLPSMADKNNVRFMDLLGDTDFLDIYDTKSI